MQNCVSCLLKSPLFNLLNEEELLLLNENRSEVTFRKGETIFKQGTKVTHVVSITSGLAKLYTESYKKDFILRLVIPINIAGAQALMGEANYTYSMAAITTTKACLIEVDAFKKVLQKNNQFALGFINDLCVKGQFIINRATTIAQKQMNGRVADTLLYLHDDIYNRNPFPNEISRRDLSDLSALSVESVIRVLKQFKESGLISEQDNEIKILDFDRLRAISENG